MMTTILSILTILLGAAAVAILATFTGTILWIAWPHALPVVLPKLVASGWIPSHLSWWTAVCLCYVWGLLFSPKINTTISKENK